MANTQATNIAQITSGDNVNCNCDTDQSITEKFGLVNGGDDSDQKNL